MKININGHGFLAILRAGKWCTTECPWRPTDEFGDPGPCACGDWCPHFGEVRDLHDEDDPDAKILRLCHGTLLVGNITDDRPQAGA